MVSKAFEAVGLPASWSLVPYCAGQATAVGSNLQLMVLAI